MNTTHTPAWRDHRDQLTDAQVESFTRREERYGHEPGYLDLLAAQAAEHVRKNHRDSERFGHVPAPAGATSVDHWEIDEIDGGWRRDWTGSTREHAGVEVVVQGSQTPDGHVGGTVAAACPQYGAVLTCHDARMVAAQLVEAAEELERIITARGTVRP